MKSCPMCISKGRDSEIDGSMQSSRRSKVDTAHVVMAPLLDHWIEDKHDDLGNEFTRRKETFGG